MQDDFVAALLKDLQAFSTSVPLESIFFGGGTPNTLSFFHYEKIFATLHQYYQFGQDCEITMEANPNLISKQWCKHVKDFGVNRLSIGVQSFFEEKLKFLQREHHYKDIFSAIAIADNIGIPNLSIDLIYDTPLDNKINILEEIKLASQLPINHLSAYSLSIEKDSKLQKQGLNTNPYSFAEEMRNALKDYGFFQYEVSNFARPYKVKHNLAYWGYEDYIGCGCGAVGKIDKTRFYTHHDLEKYIKNPTFRKKELLLSKHRILEQIFLGLRCELGVEYSILDSKKLQILLEHNKVFLKNNRVFATDYFLADELALWLF